MRKAEGSKTLRGAGLVTYGCAATAVAFILAVTLGVFEQSDAPRQVAAKFDASQAGTTQ